MPIEINLNPLSRSTDVHLAKVMSMCILFIPFMQVFSLAYIFSMLWAPFVAKSLCSCEIKFDIYQAIFNML